MDNKEIMRIAQEQSAIDMNCRPEDFLRTDNVVVPSCLQKNARKYIQEAFICNLVSYGTNIVASVKDGLEIPVQKYIDHSEFYHCFETPNIYKLNSALQPYKAKVCFMADYFLPDLTKLKPLSCEYEMIVLEKPDFEPLYVPQWSNALCEDRKELDVLGIGAYDKGQLVGFAACSADGANMWQIGVDVLPAYRRQGIASALTSRLALMIVEREKVPFYCAAWSNVKSVKNAIKCGFRPGWVELTAKSEQFIENM
ncbi:GNAT family N-acetyltransferase [Anaerosporobacter faecicola]|uniref:GNAT family N-acetyltransferase n=1 Tax=Anaerosporobacter faecicola TaxID=2718714 RepID=UPI0014388570|nr:GNAT family N-acetyltransferase [Anaerosporobacter faecicola]